MDVKINMVYENTSFGNVLKKVFHLFVNFIQIDKILNILYCVHTFSEAATACYKNCSKSVAHFFFF